MFLKNKLVIEGHPSMVIVYCEDCKEEVILGGYDGGYPRLAYRSRPNLLGGNPVKSDKDYGPRETLIRELTEEFDIGEELDWKGRKIDWSSKEDILLIRDSIIRNLQPYSDFIYEADPLEGAVKEKITAIYSVFVSKVPRNVAEIIRLNFKNGKKMTTEGFLGIYSLKSLSLAGEYSTANATGKILSKYFKILIPCHDEIKVKELSLPREKYSDYLSDYEYAESAWSRE